MLLWCCLWIWTISLRLTGSNPWPQLLALFWKVMEPLGSGALMVERGHWMLTCYSLALLTVHSLLPDYGWTVTDQLPLGPTTVPPSPHTVVQTEVPSLKLLPCQVLSHNMKKKQHRCTCLPSAHHYSQEHPWADYWRRNVHVELSWASLAFPEARLDDLATNCSHLRWDPLRKQTSPNQLDAIV